MRESISLKLAVCDNCGFNLAYPASQRCPDLCPRCFNTGRVDGKAGPASAVNPNVIDVPFSVVSSDAGKQVSVKEAKKAAKEAAKASKKK